MVEIYMFLLFIVGLVFLFVSLIPAIIAYRLLRSENENILLDWVIIIASSLWTSFSLAMLTLFSKTIRNPVITPGWGSQEIDFLACAFLWFTVCLPAFLASIMSLWVYWRKGKIGILKLIVILFVILALIPAWLTILPLLRK